MRIVINPLASRAPYAPAEAVVVSTVLAGQARAEISSWPGYAPTPLRTLPHLSQTLGISELLYKDESRRLGQGSFKVLGGAYAATLTLRATQASADTTLCCATDGNHGRSVAYAASRFGCACVVFMHRGAPATKAAAIEALGARVVRTEGTYDDSIRHAKATADAEGWVLIPDTSEDPEDPTTRLVTQGYGVMALEIFDQLASQPPPTHLFLQGGVGGLAAAMAGMMTDFYGRDRPKILVVEPEAAACLMESALRLAPSKIGGDLATNMEMLSCGEASPVAWPLLQRRADVFVTVDDADASDAVRVLSAPTPSFPGFDVGVSGAAGFAGLLQVLARPDLAAALGLDGSARVLVIGTEAGEPLAKRA